MLLGVDGAKIEISEYRKQIIQKYIYIYIKHNRYIFIIIDKQNKD